MSELSNDKQIINNTESNIINDRMKLFCSVEHFVLFF